MVDETLQVFSDVFDEYGIAVNDIELAELKESANAMAYYSPMGDTVAVNQAYFNHTRMDQAYADSIASGFHPSNGNKTALQAVVAHELGHTLTERVGRKMGISSLEQSATAVVKEARKSTKHRGVVQMASKISGYATYSNAEAIAEAFSDVFCNGKKAKSESRAIVGVLDKYLKGN